MAKISLTEVLLLDILDCRHNRLRISTQTTEEAAYVGRYRPQADSWPPSDPGGGSSCCWGEFPPEEWKGHEEGAGSA